MKSYFDFYNVVFVSVSSHNERLTQLDKITSGIANESAVICTKSNSQPCAVTNYPCGCQPDRLILVRIAFIERKCNHNKVIGGQKWVELLRVKNCAAMFALPGGTQPCPRPPCQTDTKDDRLKIMKYRYNFNYGSYIIMVAQ